MVAFSKFIPSQRNGQLLVDTDGYIYSKKRARKTSDVYVCKRNVRSKKITEAILTCPAKLLMFSVDELLLEIPHNHEPIPNESEAIEVKTGLKRKAMEQSLTPTQNIISETLSSSEDVDHLLASLRGMQRMVQRARFIPELTPGNKKSHRATYILPDECKYTVSGKDFLLYDQPGTDERIMAWSTTRNIDYVRKSDCILCDGTFSITPTPFYQMYSFHRYFGKQKTLPMIYSLLPKKDTPTYTRLAEILYEHCGDLSGVRIIIDFEAAALNAFRAVFTNAILKLCYFHFAKNIYATR